MLSKCEPRYKLPSRPTFSETIVPNLRSAVVDRVKEDLRSACSVAWTTDSWTSKSTEWFVIITANYCKYFKFSSAVIQTMSVVTYWENVGQVLKEAALEWNCQPIFLTTDNASTMPIAAKVAGISLHIGCLAHTINLASGRALVVPLIINVMAKMRPVVGLFHRRTTAASLLKNKQKLLKYQEHKLIIDVKIRWNSSYHMVQRYVEQQVTILAALTHENMSKSINKTPLGNPFRLQTLIMAKPS